jgi:hypothetical protein
MPRDADRFYDPFGTILFLPHSTLTLKDTLVALNSRHATMLLFRWAIGYYTSESTSLG